MPLFDLVSRPSPWSDPVRKLRTLESFARTEEDAGLDIARAARGVRDPELVAHLERHARDELKHAALFRGRASELRAQGVAASREELAERPYDLELARGRDALNAHGFLESRACDEQGEIAYVAFLHVAEKRADALFRRHARQLGSDEVTRAIFAEIQKDESYHVAYTKTLLERWNRAGRGAEVTRALKAARGTEFLGAWKRLGARSATGFARVLLCASYFTWVVPFGLLARLARPRAGWRTPLVSRSDARTLRSQY
jgi:rubrerythrin